MPSARGNDPGPRFNCQPSSWSVLEQGMRNMHVLSSLSPLTGFLLMCTSAIDSFMQHWKGKEEPRVLSSPLALLTQSYNCRRNHIRPPPPSPSRGYRGCLYAFLVTLGAYS